MNFYRHEACEKTDIIANDEAQAKKFFLNFIGDPQCWVEGTLKLIPGDEQVTIREDDGSRTTKPANEWAKDEIGVIASTCF